MEEIEPRQKKKKKVDTPSALFHSGQERKKVEKVGESKDIFIQELR